MKAALPKRYCCRGLFCCQYAAGNPTDMMKYNARPVPKIGQRPHFYML